MNANFRSSGIALLLVGAIGCGTSDVPQAGADGSPADQNGAQSATATLHINGFKKSKSGAI